MTLRTPTRCSHCGGALVPSTSLDLPPCCLNCGRSSGEPPTPLPLVRVEPEAARPDRSAPLRDRIVHLLRQRPMRRSEIYSQLLDGHGPMTSADLTAALAGLRQMGVVDVRNAGQRRTIWRLVDGAEPDGMPE